LDGSDDSFTVNE
jgi:hypothetical protein